VTRLFLNRDVIALAKKGPAFRPIDGDTGPAAADAFVVKDGKTFYIAAFNYGRDKRKTARIDLARAGLGLGPWRTLDLWDGGSETVHGSLTIQLVERGRALLWLER